MKTLLIRRAIVIDKNSSFHNKQADILIREGVIEKISPDIDIKDGIEIFDAKGLHVSPGWMDMHVHLRDPGQEHKETIETGSEAAAYGGFTELACMPNTNPPLDTKDSILYVKNKCRDLIVDVHPIGCVSKNREGKELAELADMHEAGAVAFTDDGAPVQSAGLMQLAMDYVKMFDGIIINHEEDLTISNHGVMNEGVMSTKLGLRGMPGLAEEIMIARDAELAQYTDSRVHVAHISTEKAVELVRKAKKEKIKITTEVCPHHFILDDALLKDYDTNFKMSPPLRTKADVEAMKRGLKDGTIEVICTDHAPHAVEDKMVEFDIASFGIIGLETCFALSYMHLVVPKILSLEQLIEKITTNPRKILYLPIPKIKAGEKANLTLFDTKEKWIFEEKHIHSKSKNTPFIGHKLQGRAKAVYNKGMFKIL